jgi:hypothetical protein
MLLWLHPRKHFSDAIDGEPLPPLLAFWVEVHRLTCPPCRRFERSLKHTVEVGRALRDLPLEDEKRHEEP